MNTITTDAHGDTAGFTRRTFLRRAAGAAAGVGAWTALSADRVIGANERVNVAIIGCGGRGRFVLRVMIEDETR